LCNRDLHEFRSLLASWNGRCANYEHAYNCEVERNSQITKAYRLLTNQHGGVLEDLAVLACKCRSLKKELDVMQTDNLAQEAVIEGYTRRLAVQPVMHHNSEKTNSLLPKQIAELESELLRMQNALVSASVMFASSKLQTQEVQLY
jgi:hypothetical protein